MGPDLVPTVKWKSALAMQKMYEKPKQMLYFIIYKTAVALHLLEITISPTISPSIFVGFFHRVRRLFPGKSLQLKRNCFYAFVHSPPDPILHRLLSSARVFSRAFGGKNVRRN